MSDQLEIRPIKTLEDLRAMQQVERMVWDDDLPIPLHQTLTVLKNGGVLLGAYLKEQMVGMLYSFPGFLNGQVYLCSHALGVLKEYRHGGIGERMKKAQAEQAKAEGYDLITWTYDPLLTPNGYLNIGKLGAVCSTYVENCYGEMTDSMNQGLPSDRFQVEWYLDRPKPTLPQGRETSLIHWQLDARELPIPRGILADQGDAPVCSVAVPANFPEIKAKDMALAREWRLLTRQVFSERFAAGWAVAGFRLNRGQGIHEYLLVPRTDLALPPVPWQKGE